MLKDSLVETRPNEDNRANFEHEFIANPASHGLIDITPMPSNHRCVVNRQGRLRMADDGFRASLDAVDLVVEDDCLLPASTALRPAWLGAMAEVLDSGQAQFFALTEHPKLESVGIVPQPDGDSLAIRLPQARMCSPDSVRSYAKLIALTPRETCVLDLLIQGYTPAGVAAELSTRESTVRTQIKSVLSKSSHNSMRGLLVTLACLPSMSAVTIGQPEKQLEHASRLPLRASDKQREMSQPL